MGEQTRFDDPGYWRDVLGGGSTADFLLQNDGLRRAIETGDPGRVHKALLQLKKASRERADLAALNAALADRRAFARETVKSPGLGRLNGFGTGMYGRTDPDRTDGTYVKTRFFSAFWLPVFPLDSWLVSDAKRGWYFLARVPLGPKLIVWRIAVLVLALLAFVGVCSRSAWSAFHTDLHIVNGLDLPVTVSIGEERLDVPPLGHVEISISNGPIELVCTDAAGTVLETITGTLTASHAAAIYNPLGAAPAYLEVVPYSVGAAAEKRADNLSRLDWLVGISWSTPSDLDFPFEDSPDEIDMPRGKSVVTRTASGVIEGGWRVAFDVMLGERSPEDAAAFAARMACVHESDLGAIDDAYAAVVETRRPESARSVVDDWVFTYGPSNGVLRFRGLLDEPLPEVIPDGEDEDE